VYAFVIDRLAQAGARVIAIDLMFPTSRQGDDAFRDALDRHENKVVIGSDFAVTEREKGFMLKIFSAPTTTLISGNAKNDDRVGYVNFWTDPDGVTRHAYYSVTDLEVLGGGSGEVYFSF